MGVGRPGATNLRTAGYAAGGRGAGLGWRRHDLADRRQRGWLRPGGVTAARARGHCLELKPMDGIARTGMRRGRVVGRCAGCRLNGQVASERAERSGEGERDEDRDQWDVDRPPLATHGSSISRLGLGLPQLRVTRRHAPALSAVPRWQPLCTFATGRRRRAMQQHHYRNLIIMAVLSFISMYVLMYAMVDRFGNVYSSMNQVYMAGLMTAPMLIIELLVMRGMYHNRRLNAAVAAASIVAGVAFFLFIRQQTGVADEQFLRSMIPHHAGAILMCERSELREPELRKLCDDIIASQQEEIEFMTAMLRQPR
jgi:uncharacterized protein (DUF305 family)